MRNRVLNWIRRLYPGEIQSTIMVAFSVISIAIILCMGSIMYVRFLNLTRQDTLESTQKLMKQTGENLEDYLVNMRQISEAAYYNLIKENDFTAQEENIKRGMNLLYEANKDDLRSIAVYDHEGNLMAAEPVDSQKKGVDVGEQEWFSQAMDEAENIHFSTPHIQNLFNDGTLRYYWVISSSRVVEIMDDMNSHRGVLLVDMDYSSIFRMMNQINSVSNGQYYYLCDKDGKIIYHPQQVQMNSGIFHENNQAVAYYKEGVHKECFEGENLKVVVNMISYTGWKLVGVIPDSLFTHEMLDIRHFIGILVVLMAMMLIVLSNIISTKISRPILKLNHSIKEYKAGKEQDIYIGGSQEIRNLGESIQTSYKDNAKLMNKIIMEQTERRKSELDALQSQINPHFLYNTLDSIIWMIEEEKNKEAAFMTSQLAKLFRISLSKGHTIISVKDEIQHAQSYMNIQRVRYRSGFSVAFEVDSSLYSYCAVKLTLQPILENAINYGVSEMDDGEIKVCGKKEGEKIILSVIDNGIGIPKEEIPYLLTNHRKMPKKGSGVGLVNVNQRIQILFGKEYGLTIESSLDEGTTVSICIPAIPYTIENQESLEKGYQFGKGEINSIEEREKHEE